MDAKLNEIEVNGVKYVPKTSQPTTELCEDYFIVRTYSAGVFAGEIVERNGQEVEMVNARRLWYWSGAASLSQLAMEGVKKPDECKFPQEVTRVVLTKAIEILSCTKGAQESIKGVKIWKQ